jgi:predicted GTPase
MAFGAGTVAAQAAGAAELVDPRPYAVGSIADVLARYPLVDALPAMGYSDEQLHELEQTIDACDCDVVVTGTPIDLSHIIRSRHPIRHASYALEETGGVPLVDVLAPVIEAASAALHAISVS